MEPVNRTQARVDALGELGLDPSAGADEIRDAWRRIAFHAHPDHTGGDYTNFSQAKAAYDYLRAEGLTDRSTEADAQPQPRRPKLRKRLIEFDAEELKTCYGLLNADLALSHRRDEAEDDDAANLAKATGRASDHVPEAVECFGRDLTFVVTSPVCEGPNRIALPTCILVTRRQAEPEILAFQSKSSGVGEVVIPDALRESKFPGAKSVRIRFDADQQMHRQH